MSSFEWERMNFGCTARISATMRYKLSCKRVMG
jgi:hypothetical protein